VSPVGARPKRFTASIVCCLMLSAGGCAHRYSEDPSDWVGPRNGDFEANFAVCKQRMEDAPFRFRGDPRLLLLDCMKQRGWHLKGRS
jgi:hypothetical protein